MAELDARRTGVRNKAAIAVQSRFRTHVAREQFLALRMTSISFQSFVRGKLFFFLNPIRGKLLLVGIETGNNAHLRWNYILSY
jgi:myosin-5